MEGFRASDFGFRVSGFGFRVSGFGLREKERGSPPPATRPESAAGLACMPLISLSDLECGVCMPDKKWEFYREGCPWFLGDCSRLVDKKKGVALVPVRRVRL